MDLITYKTRGVCSKEIYISIQDGVVSKVRFKSGCDGNLQAIGKLVEGMKAADVIEKLKGINCDGKGTSCPDQLSKALQEYLDKQEQQYALMNSEKLESIRL